MLVNNLFNHTLIGTLPKVQCTSIEMPQLSFLDCAHSTSLRNVCSRYAAANASLCGHSRAKESILSISTALVWVSLLHRGSKDFFPGGVDPLSSAGTELVQAMATGASATYHAQDGLHPGEVIFCGLLAGVVCVPGVSKDGVQDFEVK